MTTVPTRVAIAPPTPRSEDRYATASPGISPTWVSPGNTEEEGETEITGDEGETEDEKQTEEEEGEAEERRFQLNLT